MLALWAIYLARRGEELADFNAESEQIAISTISQWCLDYLRWLSEIHTFDGESIELFDVNCFKGLTGKTVVPDELSQLLFDPLQDKATLAADTIPNLRDALASPTTTPIDKGTIGLAKTLYFLCS